MADRTVHASYPGMEIVRYDKAGKWYAEPTSGGQRDHLNIQEAVYLAIAQGAQWFPGRQGGLAFDRKMRDTFGGSR